MGLLNDIYIVGLKILRRIIDKTGTYKKTRIIRYLGYEIVYFMFGNKEKNILGRSKNLKIDYELSLYTHYSAKLKKLMGSLKNKSVADLGSGDCVGHAIKFIQSDKASRFYLVDSYVSKKVVKEKKALFTKKLGLRNPSKIFNKIKIYVTSTDNLPIPDSSVDAIISTSLFEHIKPKVVKGTIKEIVRILKKGGISIISIDLRDHHDFKTPFEFYAFPEWIWGLMTLNPIHYTNRMRYTEFIRLVNKENDLEILEVETKKSKKPLPKLAGKFKKFTKDELKTDYLKLIVKKVN